MWGLLNSVLQQLVGTSWPRLSPGCQTCGTPAVLPCGPIHPTLGHCWQWGPSAVSMLSSPVPVLGTGVPPAVWGLSFGT